MPSIEIPAKLIELDLDTIDFNDVQTTKEIIVLQHNVIGELFSSNQSLVEENRKLRDEINLLKGKKGRPNIKASVPKREYNDLPNPVKETKEWKKKEKKSTLKIDDTKIVKIDKNTLPQDAVFKGYEERIKQDIIIKTNNVLYKLEKYYSPSEGKSYVAKLPEEVQKDDFGSNLKAFISYLYFKCRVTEPKIKEMLEDFGISISEGTISDIISKDKQDEFTKEKDDIFEKGMEHSDYFHIDDSCIRHKGINYYIEVLCNNFFTTFFIRGHKNKETTRDILKIEEDEQINKAMMSDDAKQFYHLAVTHLLCWIHEIRPYLLNKLRQVNAIRFIIRFFIKLIELKYLIFLQKVADDVDLIKLCKKSFHKNMKNTYEKSLCIEVPLNIEQVHTTI